MARITLDATAKQSQRIQEAVGIYNTERGENLTVREWIYLVLREAVRTQVLVSKSEEAETAQAALAATVNTDMTGGT